MHITPRRNMIAVRLAPTNAPDPTRIVQRVALEREPSWRATVEACGPEVRDVRPGMRVIVSRMQGLEVGEWVLVPESAVLAEERE